MNASVIIYSRLEVVQSMLTVFSMRATSKITHDSIEDSFVMFNRFRYEMSTVDAIDLARRAIVHAAHRDAASGNIVRSKNAFNR